MRKRSQAMINLQVNVGRLRHDRGWNQQYLADRAGVSRGTIERIERGIGDHRLGYVLQIAAILETDMNTLLARPPQK